MKKLMRVLLAAILAVALVMTAAACGDNDSSDGGETSGFVVSFDSSGGSAVKSQTVESGKHLSVPVNPVKEGSYFGGWYISAADDAPAWNFVADRVSGNMTLYAKWLPYITVTFDAHNGETSGTRLVPEGRFAARPITPERDGYDFVGWFKGAANDAERWLFESDKVTAEVTLHAHWQEKTEASSESDFTFALNSDGYTVTGYIGEGEVAVIPSKHGNRSVTAIGESAFAYSRHNAAIYSVKIPDSVRGIGKNAFYNRSDLTAVVIGENSSLVSVGNNAFSGCRALESIYLPASVTEIGESAFNNCGSLNKIEVAAENAAYSGEGNSLIEKASGTLLRGSNNSVIPTTVTAIAARAFSRASGISELVIPASVTEIGNYFIADSAVITVRFAGTAAQWEAAVAESRLWNYGNRGVELIVEG